MKRHLAVALVVAISSDFMTHAVTTNEIVGNWDAALVGTNHVPGSGDVVWLLAPMP